MDLATFKKRIDMASGKEPVDLVIENVHVVNVFSHEVIFGSVGIADGVFVGMGDYVGKKYIDAGGRVMAPGLIDSHVHIESSFGTPYQFARAVLPHGTTTIIADCHEIANVCGAAGIEFMLESSEGLPLTVYMMLPSCVPASGFETSGAILNAEDLAPLMAHPRVLGLGEMMNYPGVISGQKDILEKLKMAEKTIVDGHGPGQTEKGLNAYIISGVKTDHECTNFAEMQERIQNGMYIAIREGSAAKNLISLMPGVSDQTERRCTFCTDDRHPEDIVTEGHIDNNIRVAIRHGMDPITAVRLATLNTAECYHIRGLGAIAPGYAADFILVDDLQTFNVLETYKRGERIAPDWAVTMPNKEAVYSRVQGRVNIGDVTPDDLKIPIADGKAKVIGLKPHDLYTEHQERPVNTENGFFKQDTEKDIMPIYVLERHHGTGNIGKGLIAGFGLTNGAIASTVAHDSHNLVVVGDSERDVLLAINEIKRIGGGLALVYDGKVLGSMPLDIAGIMSSEKLEVIAKKQNELTQTAYETLHISRDVSPFMTLAFMALTVIPELKITDKGLFDVKKFELTGV
mgnify:CR=1 FL=1